MAIFHLTTKIHGRTQSVKLNGVRSLAYRNGMRIQDPNTGKIYNSSVKASEVIFKKQYLPANAPAWMKDSIKVWARIEKLENRCDAQIFREVEASFPVELGPEQWQEILDGFAKEQFTDRGMIFSAAIHFKPKNPHFHGMASLRSIVGDDFGNKNREWNNIALVYKFRQSWERHVNAALEKYGFDARISCKSYKDLEVDKVPTVHVPPDYKPKRGKVYTQKRKAAIQHNEYVQHVNNEKVQAAKQAKRSKARTDLLAGHEGASLIKLIKRRSGHDAPPVEPQIDTDNNSDKSTISLDSTTDINNGLDIVIINAPPVINTSGLSPEEEAVRAQMLEAIPNANELFIELGRVRTGLGRTWNWGTFESQYKRIDKSKPDLIGQLLAKELLWITKNKPELGSTYISLVTPNQLRKSAQTVKGFFQFSNQGAVADLEMMIDFANKKLANDNTTPLIELPLKAIPAAVIDSSITYEQALGPFKNIVTDIDSLIMQCEMLAKAGSRKFAPEILAKRVERLEKDAITPDDQDSLVKELLSIDFIFLAKKRPEKVKDALDAVPSNRRQFYEELVANVIGGQSIAATVQVDLTMLSPVSQIEVQAEKAIKASCSDFDIKDYHARFAALAVFGITYSWTEFKADIQRYYHKESGHARSWWTDRLYSLKDSALQVFREKLPTWYSEPKPPAVQPLPVTYPLAAWNEKPQSELIMRAMHSPAPTKKYTLEANGITLSVDTLEEIAEYGVEHELRQCDVMALRIEYFQKVGFYTWETELNKEISRLGMYGHGESKEWLQEQFTFRDPSDVASMFRTQMDALTYQGDLVPAPSPIYSNTPFVKAPEPKFGKIVKPKDD
jgi:hypothetical protein